MYKKYLPFLLFILLIIITACGGSGNALSEAAAPPGVDDGFFEAETASDTGAVSREAGFSSPDQQPLPPQERLIIRDASIDIVVTDTDETLATITQMAESNNGWVVSSNVFQYGENNKRANITFRIPVEGFNNALATLRDMAVTVTSESASGQDVTEEFVDLSARLQNLEATAERVRQFLDEADNVEEALAVNQELSRLEEQIEVIKGRMQFLSQSAAFSTITVNITPDILTQPIETTGWRPSVVVRDAVEVLLEVLQGIAEFLIRFVIVVLPLAIIFGLPLWLVIRFVRNRRATSAITELEESGETEA